MPAAPPRHECNVAPRRVPSGARRSVATNRFGGTKRRQFSFHANGEWRVVCSFVCVFAGRVPLRLPVAHALILGRIDVALCDPPGHRPRLEGSTGRSGRRMWTARAGGVVPLQRWAAALRANTQGSEPNSRRGSRSALSVQVSPEVGVSRPGETQIKSSEAGSEPHLWCGRRAHRLSHLAGLTRPDVGGETTALNARRPTRKE